MVSDIIKNTNGEMKPSAKINSWECIALEVRQILGKFNMAQLQRIYKTATFLNMDDLKKNVAAMIGVRVYVADEKDFEQKQKDL